MQSSGSPRASCIVAERSSDIERHHQIRDEVFVRQEALFPGTDRDALDDATHTIKLLGLYGDLAVGTGRLWLVHAETGTWRGDRRAVLRDYRQHGIGIEIVRFAVEQIRERNGRELTVQIPVKAVDSFERMGWQRVGTPTIYVGVMHQLMLFTI